MFGILTGIPGNSFKVLQNSGIPQDFESAGFGILHRLLLSFLEILKFLGTQFSVVHREGGGYFLEQPIQWQYFETLKNRSYIISHNKC